jgi:hypothetical protein
MLLWPRLVCGATAVLWSSPGPHLPKLYGRRSLAAPGALLGSPFNMKWRFSAPAGDVEESKLCLFSVIMPAKCVSSISPRFHYRRLAFCFLPLAAILEFHNFSFFGISVLIPAWYGHSFHHHHVTWTLQAAVPCQVLQHHHHLHRHFWWDR